MPDLGRTDRTCEPRLGGKLEYVEPVGFNDPNDSIQLHEHRVARLGDQVFGVLSVTSRTENVGYTHEDLQSLQILGEHAGICARHTEKTRGRDAA